MDLILDSSPLAFTYQRVFFCLSLAGIAILGAGCYHANYIDTDTMYLWDYIVTEPLSKPAADMDADDLEFLQAVDEFRRTCNQFPRLTDYLAILRDLGWRKVPVDTACQADSKIVL